MTQDQKLTTLEAIARRRAIRRYKPDPIPDDVIRQLLDAARLAPSGCNAQPWRFKVATDPEERRKLAQAAADQMFLAQAPAVIVCCADLKGYLEGSVSGVQDLEKRGVASGRVARIIEDRTVKMNTWSREQLAPGIAFNIAIAGEHIVLRALDFGLGTCWVKLFDEAAVRAIWGWDENLYVAALLPIGYPDQDPEARPRKGLDEIML